MDQMNLFHPERKNDEVDKVKTLRSLFGNDLLVEDKEAKEKKGLYKDYEFSIGTFVRGNEDILKIRYIQERLLCGSSLRTNKDVMIKKVDVNKVSSRFVDLLKEGDKIRVRFGYTTRTVTYREVIKTRQKNYNCVVYDEYDKEICVIKLTDILSVAF